MRSLLKKTLIPLIAITTCLFLSGTALAAGLLKPVGANDDAALAISAHRVDVTINNGFVRTEVDQVFTNSGTSAIEGLYSFPLPHQASLSELSMWVGEREILGEVVEKERSRQIYEQQKAQGNQVALAEKNDFKSFDTRIGNIPPQADVRVLLVYYQPMSIDLNIGRYLYPLREGNTDEERLSFWSVDDRVSGPFHFHLQLKSAFPIKDVRLPGLENEAVIQYGGVTHGDGEEASEQGGEQGNNQIVDVTIDRPAGASLNKDIVFLYRLDDTTPARIELIPYKADRNATGTMMLVVTPAADLQPITEGTDWTFVLDVSGSMDGHKIATLADGVSQTLGKLNSSDRFRIITFNQSAADLTRGFVTATPEAVGQWINRVKTIAAGGSTNLFAGLETACRRLDDDRTTSIVLVTDGVANVGRTEQREFLQLLKEYDVRLFTFVIGNSANRPLLDRLAKDSGGFAMQISDVDDIQGRLIQAKAKVLYEKMHDVRIEIDGEKVDDLTPATIGNLYLGQQLVLFGHYHGSGKVTIKMKARISGEEKEWRCTAMLPEVATDNPELERLWALSRIDELMAEVRELGETEQFTSRIVDLGVHYSLVTDYTSMLVLNDDVYEQEGVSRRNADRVAKERQAQQQRSQQPVRNYRVDNAPQQRSTDDASAPAQQTSTFNNRPSPGIGHGSGPVSLIAVPLVAWLNRRKRNR
ncbi:MAG: VWA domain-containing protein [Desulfuromonas sp.]|nr:MAG: VWA domain-containing protein [Desulfuromonas sp.]